MKANKKSIEEFEHDEDAMPCRCEECHEWFDLEDGGNHPKKENLIICDTCTQKLEAAQERLEEIEELLNSISDAEFTINEARQQLITLNYNPEVDKPEY